MRDLQKVATECVLELRRIGINPGYVKEFRVNSRAKSRWGMCSNEHGTGFIIEISDRLLSDDAPEKALKNTIIHELLHTCKGTKGHGTEWKRLADRVNVAYDYGIKRCSSAEEKGVAVDEKPNMAVKHRFECQKCGLILDRTRESNFTKAYDRYRCGKCNGSFKKIF